MEFKDLGFKLAVINELMYVRQVLKPKFNVNEFVKSYEKRKIDIEEEGYEVIPEVLEYFKNLEIPPNMTTAIEELWIDAGNDIYGEILPFWNGEDDTFNIRSACDAHHLHNLKKVTMFCNNDVAVIEEFRERGIAADHM